MVNIKQEKSQLRQRIITRKNNEKYYKNKLIKNKFIHLLVLDSLVVPQCFQGEGKEERKVVVIHFSWSLILMVFGRFHK